MPNCMHAGGRREIAGVLMRIALGLYKGFAGLQPTGTHGHVAKAKIQDRGSGPSSGKLSCKNSRPLCQCCRYLDRIAETCFCSGFSSQNPSILRPCGSKALMAELKVMLIGDSPCALQTSETVKLYVLLGPGTASKRPPPGLP